jgi:penicillin amidase
LGSNNWAVAPARTRDHAALLAGDPHLDLTLPSIWYEAHVVVPGRLDLYGVTIPGTPGVIIGFNRDVAWTFTNTGADVLDYYRETVDDSDSPTRYRVDGEWRTLERQVQEFRGPDGRVLQTDTTYYTHRGPMARDAAGRWISIRWTAHERSDESAALLDAAHARSAAEWQRATATYTVPAQNMLVADRAGTIAIRSTGRFPLRASGVSGDTVLDGSRSAADWIGWRPESQMPQSTSPGQGFLASANQEPTDPVTGAPSLGSNWFSPWRAMRIDALLRANAHVTPADMRRYQTDPGSARADAFVPLMLEAARRRGDDDALRAATWLAAWDRRYTRANTGAMLFERAMQHAAGLTWDELVAAGTTQRVFTPQDMLLLELCGDSASAWWDRRSTPELEHRDDVLSEALRVAYRDMLRDFGPPGDAWRWDRVHDVDIPHLLRIPALGRLDVPVSGGPSTLSPSSMNGGGFAASWRMVVELGPELRAWSTYPGGQSANPASPHYADRIAQWAAGELDPIFLPRSAAEIDGAHQDARLMLTPAAR